MKVIASFIVKYRIILFAAFILFAVYCVILIPRVNIGYSLLDYLPEKGETLSGINVMNQEFGEMEQLRVYMRNTNMVKIRRFIQQLEEVEGVQYVSFNGDASDFKGADAIISIMVGHEARSDSDILDEVEQLAVENNASVLGALKTSSNLRKAIAEQMPIILLIAFAIILLVLFLTSDSYLEPLLFTVVIGISIVMNLGTNAWLPKVSFITHAICAIMQLAMAMDYAIMLLHRFREEEKKTDNVKEALTNAISKSITAISGSSLTTIVGLAALMLMQFRLGYDLGMVLIKGILLSMLTVFLFMPGLLLFMNKLLHKTMHKRLIPKSKNLGRFIFKSRKVLPFILIVVIAVGIVGASRLKYDYAVSDMGANCYKDYSLLNAEVNEKFGKSNTFVLLLPVGNEEKEIEVSEFIQGLDSDEIVVRAVTGMGATPFYKNLSAEELSREIDISVDITQLFYEACGLNPNERVNVGSLIDMLYENRTDPLLRTYKGAIEAFYDLAQQGKALLVGENYTRIMITFGMADDSEIAFETVELLRDGIKDYYSEFYLFGNTVNMYDIRATFPSDMILTNMVTIVAIMLILLVIFRRISFSVLLVAVIQGAVQINSSITAFSGQPMFFCCKLFVDCILMGATVDYAILLTSRFKEARLQGQSVKEAVLFAMDATVITLLTSGAILVLAGFIIGLVSTVGVISEIGLLVGRGALISIILIVFLLPQCLIFLDAVNERWKNRRSKGKTQINNSESVEKTVDKNV